MGCKVSKTKQEGWAKDEGLRSCITLRDTSPRQLLWASPILLPEGRELSLL